ncbi:MAG: methicillin resistance protein [uncultured bacterium]|nr:MAG: methicillin resistance protein [uncultured bacterium]
MQVKILQNILEWNKATLRLNGSFIQSWQWGDILIAEGKKVERLAVEKDGVVTIVAQIMYMPLVFGWRYAFCPKGPVGDLNAESLSVLSDYFKSKKIVFWRMEPKEKKDNANLIKSRDINPSSTMILDLQKSEEEILAGMHSKTRYNINLSQKKNLEVKNEKNLSVFWELMKKTGQRDDFRLHEPAHYQAILDSDFSTQLTVYSHDKAIATMVLIGYGDIFTYLFGASDHDYRNLMAPYLLQWSAMMIGKKNGYKSYDFFGVAPNVSGNEHYEYSSEHQYGGVSRFKSGFGADYVEAPGTFDLVINRFKYNLYLYLRKLRRMV